jgi:hypothetical protein
MSMFMARLISHEKDINISVSSSAHISSGRKTMNWKGVIMKLFWSNFEVPPLHFSGDTEETYGRHQSGYSITLPRFLPMTSRIQIISFTRLVFIEMFQLHCNSKTARACEGRQCKDVTSLLGSHFRQEKHGNEHSSESVELLSCRRKVAGSNSGIKRPTLLFFSS